MRGFLKSFLTFEGRIPRSQFWMCRSGVLVLLGALAVLAESKQIPGWLASMGVWLSFWPLLATQAKRWHDLDISGAWILINGVPIVGGLYALIMLGFVAGTSGPNEYGANPLERQYAPNDDRDPWVQKPSA
ncbi:MAG: DUF805 domain-containing protein [Planctomycetia bacterium]|nr:DUF805 domain-containing protein [Planctomycetia bacterium]